MSVEDHTLTQAEEAPAPIVLEPRHRWQPHRRGRGDRPRKPRLRKLRLFLTLVGFGLLAFVSAVFGMAMSVTHDLPTLENAAQLKLTVNSYLYDDHGRPIGILEPPTHKVIDTWQDISPAMVHAIVAIEDKRFWTDPGVDLRGLLRAFVSDATGGPKEGASTIAEQFVKNALAEQDNRTIFEKLREAALAFQLVHHWPRTKILTEYLNTIYFGEGAYGIESAARVFFGWAHGYNAGDGPDQVPGACGDPTAATPNRPECARKLTYWEAALLAGMVANPSAFDPIMHPAASEGRRNLVLLDMYQQGYITHAQYEYGINRPLPTAADIQQPQEPPAAPYFTSWLRPQIIAALEHEGVPAKLAAYKAFYGGLKIRTTIDLPMQEAAQQAIDAEFPPGSNGPTAALVSIDNQTGEVRAMVSGNGDYTQSPFNLATLGHRQPGSSFKPFTLSEALLTGEYTPYSVIDSAPQDFIVPNSAGKEHFIVHNFGNTYSGPITLTEATAISDNTVFSQVGIHVGTKRIARLATRMGIRSPISDNYAMILGGLKIGVSPLDMAHAYETLATGGLKVYNPTLGDMDVQHCQGHGAARRCVTEPGPTGIAQITCPNVCPFKVVRDHPTYKRILPQWVTEEVHTMLEGVVGPGGTAPMAAIPGVVVAGKTGTTSNYADAWFVGWTPQLTTAVWVGYPQGAIPMNTNYNGAPVEGGTFPAIIWHNFMVQALQILANEQAEYGPHKAGQTATTLTTQSLIPSTGGGSYTTPGAATTPANTTGGATTPGATTTPGAATTPATTTPANTGGATTTPAAPTPTPAPSPPSGGTSGTGGAGIGG